MDAAAVASAVIIGVVNTGLRPSNGLFTLAPVGAVAAFSGAVGLLLWWRRRRPVIICGLVMLCHALAFVPTALAIALYTVGTACHRQLLILVLCAVTAGFADIVALEAGGDADGREVGYSLALAIGPLVVGYVMALRRELSAVAQAQLDTMGREQELLVERTRIEERSRIAREMHDVAAHRVGHIVVIAGALRVGAAASDPEVARAADLIRAEGRQALEELREILGVLTPGRAGRAAPRAPQPDASGLSDLVERARHTGQEAAMRIKGHPETLPTVIQQALYRTVQETLTNAAKHAPGAATFVDLHCHADGVHLTVTNGPPTRPPDHHLPTGGHGLVGLRERAALLGGRIDAGPYANGFRVTLRLPTQPLAG